MNTHVKNFLVRGLMFSGLGPVVAGIVYLILYNIKVLELITPVEMFVVIITTYILAFVVAGASVFYDIEKWSIVKSTILHGIILYISYITCYLLNNWIDPDWINIIIFTLIFIVGYIFIWISIYFTIKATSKKLNAKLANM